MVVMDREDWKPRNWVTFLGQHCSRNFGWRPEPLATRECGANNERQSTLVTSVSPHHPQLAPPPLSSLTLLTLTTATLP
jgi:hypothetical protein